MYEMTLNDIFTLVFSFFPQVWFWSIIKIDICSGPFYKRGGKSEAIYFRNREHKHIYPLYPKCEG